MGTTPEGLQFLDPWHQSDQELHEELEREMSPRHQLYGIKARAIALRQDCDDVLFELLGERAPAALAVVHLTWSGKEDRDPRFPWVELYDSFTDWTVRCMLPDAENWNLSN